ncbi:hypothetical protein FHT76_005419 [Rhizobium sp. BK176]|nr:hypothetical protein [Rhizobium sp. BK176]
MVIAMEFASEIRARIWAVSGLTSAGISGQICADVLLGYFRKMSQILLHITNSGQLYY